MSQEIEYTPEQWARLLAMGTIDHSAFEREEKNRKFLKHAMMPDFYSPKPVTKRRPAPIPDIPEASEVTITRPDGTVETQPAYTFDQASKIIGQKKYIFIRQEERDDAGPEESTPNQEY